MEYILRFPEMDVPVVNVLSSLPQLTTSTGEKLSPEYLSCI